MFRCRRPVAAAPPLPRAPRPTPRAGAGPRRFSALWPELQARLMEAYRGAPFARDEPPEAPRTYAGGDA